MLPQKFKWLENIGTLPKMVSAAIQYLGIKEIPGKGSNPVILNMAKQLGIADIYVDDDMPWCALFGSFLCFITGKPLPAIKGDKYNLIRAFSFVDWGIKVEKGDERLGDVIVMKRKGGYHWCICIAQTKTTFVVIGGNQSNSVTFTEVSKADVIAVRRLYQTQMPESAKVYTMDSSGELIKSAA